MNSGDTYYLDRDESLLFFILSPSKYDHDTDRVLDTKGLCPLKLTPDKAAEYEAIEKAYFKMQWELDEHWTAIQDARKKGNEFV